MEGKKRESRNSFSGTAVLAVVGRRVCIYLEPDGALLYPTVHPALWKMTAFNQVPRKSLSGLSGAS